MDRSHQIYISIMRFIYRLRYYRNCCLNDVQFDNIEYFAKTKQSAYREHAYISLRGDAAG